MSWMWFSSYFVRPRRSKRMRRQAPERLKLRLHSLQRANDFGAGATSLVPFIHKRAFAFYVFGRQIDYPLACGNVNTAG